MLTLAVIFYKFVITAQHDFFEKRGIPFIKPVPFFGTFAKAILGFEDLYHYYKKCWKQVGDVPFFGTFEFLEPVYVIKDADLAKQILIKDFDHFINHRVTVDHDIDPVFGRNLFTIDGQRWRDMRNVLSPAFTGSKMRILFQVINQCAMASVEQVTKSGKEEFEVKDFFTRITNDVIATAAFGVETKSIQNTNEFYIKARQLSDFGIGETMKFYLYSTLPKLMRFTGMKIFPKYKTQFLEDLVRDQVKYREETNFTRPDMIHLLLQAKHKGYIEAEEDDEKAINENSRTKTKWTDDDIISQCLLFFLAGFETASTLYVYLAYELALDQDIQEKLRAEVDELNERLDGKIPVYEDIIAMKYMDMVVSECLRKWPPNIAIDRRANKDYELSAQGMSVTVKAGEAVVVPTIAFHHDEKHFPDPLTFDPERFSDENKGNIHPAAYTPFGIGPRQCIGNRLALMQAKIFYYHLLTKYTIERNERTEVPVQIRKGVMIVTPLNGLWLSFKPRA